MIEACVGLMSTSVLLRRRGCSRSRFVKDVASWPRNWDVSRNERGSREAPDPFAPGRVRSGVSLQRLVRQSQVPWKTRCRLPGQSRADFPEVSLQLLDLSALELVAFGGFFRQEKHTLLEARSIRYAVRHADSTCPPGRLLILSDNLAPVLSLCKGRPNNFTLLPVTRRIELNYSDKGSRFFDREHDPSKSLLHFLAQRLPRFPHAQTGDRSPFPPSLMQLDDGEVDREPRECPITHTFADLSSVWTVLSDLYRPRCAGHDGDGHTAAVSSHCSAGVCKNYCVRGFGKQLCHVSSAPVDVVWATSWFGWNAKSGWKANAVLVSWK